MTARADGGIFAARRAGHKLNSPIARCKCSCEFWHNDSQKKTDCKPILANLDQCANQTGFSAPNCPGAVLLAGAAPMEKLRRRRSSADGAPIQSSHGCGGRSKWA